MASQFRAAEFAAYNRGEGKTIGRARLRRESMSESDGDMAAEPQGPVPPATIAKRYRWWGHPVALLRNVLSQDDTPHHIALGGAIGMFVGLTPTPGAQMLLVLAVYYATRRFLKFNLPAGLAAVYVSNPLTAVPLAWLNYQAGRMVLGGEMTWEELRSLIEYDGFADWWRKTSELVVEFGGAYLLGSIIVAAVAAVLTYPVMLYLLHLVRRKPAGASGAADSDPSLSVTAGREAG
jgi:uncharacterized protein (DUF2062 family)